MPTRLLREGILTSERIAKLGWAEEVFYRRLMSVVDDYGRFYALPALIRAACYPLQIDKVSDSDIEKWLRCAEKAALVRVYPASDGKRYLEILDFGQRIQTKAKFPANETNLQKPTEYFRDPPKTSAIGVVGDGVEDVGVDTREKRKPAARKTRLPADFVLSERVKAWAKQKGFERLDEHLDYFRSKCLAKGYEYVDWDEAFMGAVRADWAKLCLASAPSRARRELKA